MFTFFVVRNEGYLTIRDVSFSCAIKYLKVADGGPLIVAAEDYENRFSDPRQVSGAIVPGEEASELLPLSGMQNNRFANADIAIRLEYKPGIWLPFRKREELHRFVLKKGKDGQWHWLPQPIRK